MPRVSIITATYNRPHYLREAVESVLAQRYGDWELIVIDDGSTDETRNVVEGFLSRDSRIRYFFQKKQYLPKTRMRGVALAQGEYVAFLDDDDVYLPHKLESQVRFLDSHRDVGLVYSAVDFVDASRRFIQAYPKIPARCFRDLIQECTIQTSSLLVRKECFDRVGTFRHDLISADDYEMWLRIARCYRFEFLPGTVAFFRWHHNNMSHDKERRYRSLMEVYRSLLQADLSQEDRALTRRRCAELTYPRAVNALDHGEYLTAAKLFLDAARYHPAIGLHISWSRWPNPVYRWVRPYLALIYCHLIVLMTWIQKGLKEGKS